MNFPAALRAISQRIAEIPTFMPGQLVMVDCEMTGVVPERDALLQVAMLKLAWDGCQYVEFDAPYVGYLKYNGKPETDFHKKYLSHIFEICNKSELTPEIMKQQVHEWLGELKGTVTPAGDCVIADLSFLYQNRCIDRPDIAKDGSKLLGTFHYEIADMNLLKAVARQKVCNKIEVPGLDTEHIHDALVDCRNQTVELNAFLNILL